MLSTNEYPLLFDSMARPSAACGCPFFLHFYFWEYPSYPPRRNGMGSQKTKIQKSRKILHGMNRFPRKSMPKSYCRSSKELKPRLESTIPPEARIFIICGIIHFTQTRKFQKKSRKQAFELTTTFTDHHHSIEGAFTTLIAKPDYSPDTLRVEMASRLAGPADFDRQSQRPPPTPPHTYIIDRPNCLAHNLECILTVVWKN